MMLEMKTSAGQKKKKKKNPSWTASAGKMGHVENRESGMEDNGGVGIGSFSEGQ